MKGLWFASHLPPQQFSSHFDSTVSVNPFMQGRIGWKGVSLGSGMAEVGDGGEEGVIMTTEVTVCRGGGGGVEVISTTMVVRAGGGE